MPVPPPVPADETQRRLLDLHPAISQRSLETFRSRASLDTDADRLDRQLRYLDRLIDIRAAVDVAVMGCGPVPVPVRRLAELGYRAVGIEVVPAYVTAAREFLHGMGEVVEADIAVATPFAAGSFDVVWCEDVIEHVESPRRALEELHRILRPGGIAIVSTTNRLQLIPETGGEFAVPLFRWFPPIVRESFVFHHLHRRPELARYTSRPAVHWFTYAELCRLGRDAGFARFYSLIDLLHETDPAVRKSALRRTVIRLAQRNAWVRAAALTQLGNTILMLRRPDTDR